MKLEKTKNQLYWLIIGAMIFLGVILSFVPLHAQNTDSLKVSSPSIHEAMENDLQEAFDHQQEWPKPTKNKGRMTNFQHWNYSKKKHAFLSYYGSSVQFGFNGSQQTHSLNHSLGLFYKGSWIESKNYKMKVHGWVEQNSLLAGVNTKQFGKDLGIFSQVNGFDATGHALSLEYLYVQNLFFDDRLDISIGKIDPLFSTLFTNYAGWDRMTFFSKTMTSNPVPPMGTGFGMLTEFHLSNHVSIGALAVNANEKSPIMEPHRFFSSNQPLFYQGFVRWNIPTKDNLYSSHVFTCYGFDRITSAEYHPMRNAYGWAYVGNQGLSKKSILTLKASAGNGMIQKYRAGYGVGFVHLSPFNRHGDQLGYSVVLNEGAGAYEGRFEAGVDAYYKMFVRPWFTASVNMQIIYGVNQKMNYVPGFRVMMTF
ncbi:hypothetical protein [Persicobacter psychrovividus]|uniref:Porin n=1 Tax=Persicobacter psychrovividus TaxID=387638 RepID=A0ABM7VME0_9BACT|nr:hypothetical protein PEPS_44290 [Persicobacter psychrovividus]